MIHRRCFMGAAFASLAAILGFRTVAKAVSVKPQVISYYQFCQFVHGDNGERRYVRDGMIVFDRPFTKQCLPDLPDVWDGWIRKRIMFDISEDGCTLRTISVDQQVVTNPPGK